VEGISISSETVLTVFTAKHRKTVGNGFYLCLSSNTGLKPGVNEMALDAKPTGYIFYAEIVTGLLLTVIN